MGILDVCDLSLRAFCSAAGQDTTRRPGRALWRRATRADVHAGPYDAAARAPTRMIGAGDRILLRHLQLDCGPYPNDDITSLKCRDPVGATGDAGPPVVVAGLGRREEPDRTEWSRGKTQAGVDIARVGAGIVCRLDIWLVEEGRRPLRAAAPTGLGTTPRRIHASVNDAGRRIRPSRRRGRRSVVRRHRRVDQPIDARPLDGNRGRSGQVKAPTPVMSRPTMRLWTCSVPS